MSDHEKIERIKNKDIDYDKWDHCIHNAPNGNLYAKSWYLDVVSPGWEALIMGDYEIVMPLTVVRKFGIPLLIQPLHCQQLGIFPAPPKEIQELFALEVYRSFLIVRYQLNAGMLLGAFRVFRTIKKTNYVMPLYENTEHHKNGYSKHTVRNIKVAEREGVSVVRGLLPSDYLSQKSQHIRRHIPRKSHKILNYVMVQSITRGSGMIYSAYSGTNALCAAAFFLFDHDRVYYLNAFSTDEGKKNRAMYAIVHEFIKDYSGKDLILDFEGSVIEGIARFYRGFGAIREDYFLAESSKLPFTGWI